MYWDVSVSLLVSVVLRNVVQVISSDDDGSLHFGGDDNTLENLSSDRYAASERTFLIDVVSFNGFLGSFEAEPDAFEVPDP